MQALLSLLNYLFLYPGKALPCQDEKSKLELSCYVVERGRNYYIYVNPGPECSSFSPFFERFFEVCG